MRLDDDLEEIIKLAFQASPQKAEYYLSRAFRNCPRQFETTLRSNSPYQEDRTIVEENKEFFRLEHLISIFRSAKQ